MTRHPSILVIEDDPLYRTLYTAKIRQRLPHARLLGVADGEEALDVLTHSRPELLILDLHIPRIDGKRLLELIKSNESNDAVVSLVISAFDEDLSEIGRRAYRNVFAFNKPMRADDFEIALGECMDLVNAQHAPFRPGADSVIDHSHMRLYIGEDPRLHHALSAQFVDNAQAWIHSLRHHLDTGDRVKLSECARNIWAAAATIGAHESAKLAHRLGFAAQESNQDLAVRLGKELIAALDAYCTALAGELAEMPKARGSSAIR